LLPQTEPVLARHPSQRCPDGLLLAVTDFCPHSSLFSSYFSSSFAGFLGTHLVHAPVGLAEIGKPLDIENGSEMAAAAAS
jgi:hypothetical protein